MRADSQSDAGLPKREWSTLAVRMLDGIASFTLETIKSTTALPLHYVKIAK
jgi:hypothetical protein